MNLYQREQEMVQAQLQHLQEEARLAYMSRIEVRFGPALRNQLAQWLYRMANRLEQPARLTQES